MPVNFVPVRCMTRKRYSYNLPSELEDVSDANLPLYVLVALWALRQKRPVTVRDVRNAFDLSLRRASDVLEYMTEQGSSVVEARCTLRPLCDGDKRKRREWHVYAVNDERARISKIPDNINTKHSRRHKDNIHEFGHWFLHWRPGKTPPDN